MRLYFGFSLDIRRLFCFWDIQYPGGLIVSELLLLGDLKPIATLAKKITGEHPSRQTTWRWIHKGVAGGVKLEAVPCINGAWKTTEAAFYDFLSRRAEARLKPRETAPSATDADLRAAGLL